jgi:hypothetical protein
LRKISAIVLAACAWIFATAETVKGVLEKSAPHSALFSYEKSLKTRFGVVSVREDGNLLLQDTDGTACARRCFALSA